MLKALWRKLWPQDAVTTQPVTHPSVQDWVSRAEFDAAIQKIEQRIEWDLSEWYDKFSTLHARTAKRQQRAHQQNGKSVEQEPQEVRPSVLHHRKPWSP